MNVEACALCDVSRLCHTPVPTENTVQGPSGDGHDFIYSGAGRGDPVF